MQINLKACVIFATRYGNTEKIAKSLEAGLKVSGILTSSVNANEMNVNALAEYDLICVGGPTEWHSATKPMKEFLGKMRTADLSGKYGFAFDTRLTRPLSGSAAGLVEKELKSLGLQIIAPRESATVFLAGGTVSGAYLKEGEEERFRQIGARIGETLAHVTKMQG
jgi:flavodoxin